MEAVITIDRRVELPAYSFGRKRYPFAIMLPISGTPPRGDSFLVPCVEEEYAKVESSLTSCIAHQRKRYGRRYTMRRTEEGIRVWRTA